MGRKDLYTFPARRATNGQVRLEWAQAVAGVIILMNVRSHHIRRTEYGVVAAPTPLSDCRDERMMNESVNASETRVQ